MSRNRKRRTRADSVDFAVRTAQAGEPEPPAHCDLQDSELPFWRSIVRAKHPDEWTPTDLELAVDLARAKANLDRLEREVRDEPDVMESAQGTPMVNPKFKMIESLSRRVLSLSKALHIHSRAVNGERRDQDARRKVANGLLAKPH